MIVQLIGSDRNGSPLFTRSAGVNSLFCWSPFGGSAPRSGSSVSLPGFNGERQDPLSGVTHLGNGYRAYSPKLRRFNCPDSESPFGVGGINPYAYCDNDPINRTDPSGHGPIIWLIRKIITLGLRITLEEVGAMSAALSTTGMVETGLELASSASTGIASGVMKKKGNPEMAQKLGWASMGLGLAGGFGLATGDAAMISQRMRGLYGRNRANPGVSRSTWYVRGLRRENNIPATTVYENNPGITGIPGSSPAPVLNSIPLIHSFEELMEEANKLYTSHIRPDGNSLFNLKKFNNIPSNSSQFRVFRENPLLGEMLYAINSTELPAGSINMQVAQTANYIMESNLTKEINSLSPEHRAIFYQGEIDFRKKHGSNNDVIDETNYSYSVILINKR